MKQQACERHDADKCLLYRLVAYYPKQKLFVIERNAYESFDVVVVARRGGAFTRMDDHPRLAPNGMRLAVVAASEAWNIEKDIAIYSIRPGSLNLEWSYKAQEYEMWEFAGWAGSDRINLNVTLWKVDARGERSLVTQRGEVQRTGAGWQLNKNELPR